MKRKTKPKMERRWAVLILTQGEWCILTTIAHQDRGPADAHARRLRRYKETTVVVPIMTPKVPR